MVTVQLTEQEAVVLARSLEWLLSETRMEIADTEQVDFRDGIKQEKAALQNVISQLRAAAPL